MGPSPMNSTSTLYDVLGLPSTASEGDIHAAHMRLVRHYQYGINGLSAAEANQQLQAVKGAWWTLSDPGRRAAYDARLADPFAPVLDPQALSHLAASPGAVGAAPSAGASASVMGGKSTVPASRASGTQQAREEAAAEPPAGRGRSCRTISP